MAYKVIITSNAEDDLDRFLNYLVFYKENRKATLSVLEDFAATKDVLTEVAGSLKLCSNPRLNELGYRRINFQKHRYFMLYRIEGNLAIVDGIFHFLQDYKNKFF